MPTLPAREVMIFCAEELRATACVVVDALVVRGWNVSLETGANARKALALSLRTPRRGLRVVCLPERIDKKTHRRLLEGFDGDLRQDLLLVPLLTPRAVIEAIELREGIRRQRPSRRYTKAYLPYPTIAESRAAFGKLSGVAAFAVVGAVAVAFGLGGYTAAPEVGASMASLTPAPVVEREVPSRLLDDAVYSATARPSSLDDDEDAYRPRRRKRPRRTARAPQPTEVFAAVPDEEEVIIIDDESEDDAATDALLDAMAAHHRAGKTAAPSPAETLAQGGNGLDAAVSDPQSHAPAEQVAPNAVSRTAVSPTDADGLRDPWPAKRKAKRPTKRRRVGAPKSFRRGKRRKSVAPVDPFASKPL